MRTDAPKGVIETLAAIRYLESAVTGAEGIEGVVLRYGGFYGPGTNLGGEPGGEMTEMVRKRRMPILGEGTGVWSFVHIADAASATVAAVERGAPGIYNVTDDEPAPVKEWLPVLAQDVGAKPPMRMPAFLARIIAGPAVFAMMNEIRGASNAKAKRELGWAPTFPSWREGFVAVGRAPDVYEELRPLAFSIAYRMLGTASEAEDVVQEGMLRLHRALDEGEGVDSPRAYLSTVVTRLAIDELRSARSRREVYVGEWLPEPILTTEGTTGEADPAAEAEMADSLSLSFLVVLETLTPEQRAAFLLREVFDYPYDKVAEVLGKSEPASRQLVSRAKGELDERRPRFETSREQRDRLTQRFLEAARTVTSRGSRRSWPTTWSCTATAVARPRRSPGP